MLFNAVMVTIGWHNVAQATWSHVAVLVYWCFESKRSTSGPHTWCRSFGQVLDLVTRTGAHLLVAGKEHQDRRGFHGSWPFDWRPNPRPNAVMNKAYLVYQLGELGRTGVRLCGSRMRIFPHSSRIRDCHFSDDAYPLTRNPVIEVVGVS